MLDNVLQRADDNSIIEEYETLVASLDDLVFEVDTEYTFRKVWSSGNIEPIFKKEYILHKKIQELFSGNLLQLFMSGFEKAIRTRQKSNVEYSLSFNNEIHWYNANILAQFISGSLKKYIIVISDITERKNLEIELQESERKYYTLLSNLPGMAYRCKNDSSWTMEFASNGTYALTGYSPDDFINNKRLGYSDIVCKEFQQEIWNQWQNAIKSKGIFHYEYKIQTKDGSIKWVWEQGQGIFNSNGELQALEGLIIDISARKSKEQRVHYLSYFDALTGLHNRRSFEENLHKLDTESNLPLSVIMGDVNGLKLTNDIFGHAEGDKLLNVAAGIIKSVCRKEDIVARWGGDEFIVLLPSTTEEETEQICNRIHSICRSEVDRIFEFTLSLGFSTKTASNQNTLHTIRQAENYMYEHKLLENRSLRSTIIASIRNTLFEKSFETEMHAERLKGLSLEIGNYLGLSSKLLNELELFCVLHDIGKIAISESILSKTEKLSVEDWLEIKRHPEIGYRIALSAPELSHIADLILSHHEHWNGNGYPRGLSGENIPLLSRILSIVDAYDAMTNDRAYRKAMSKEEAVRELVKNSGTQFDPDIVKVFVANVL